MLLVLTLAHAAAPVAADPAVEADVDARLLDQVAHAEELPCLTPLVEELRVHWAHFSVAERAEVSAVLAPNGRDLFAPMTPKWSGAAPPPAKDTCWSEFDNRLVGEHFVVEYQDGVNSDDAAQFLDDLETSWSKEVDDLGWDPPPGADDYLMLVEVQNQRTNGAYTTIMSCGGSSLPYIVTGKNSWDDPNWGRSMAPHEFNHSLQFGYSYAPEFWWWEATATYMEDQVFPSINYWSPYVQGYTDNPYIALSASSQSDEAIFNHMYGLAILAFYLDNYQGGEDTVRETWEDAKQDNGQYSRSARQMAAGLGLDWDLVYPDWISRNTMMDYDQQRYFPPIDLHDEVSKLPATGKSSKSDTPQGYGQNYIAFPAGMGRGDLVVHFTGDDAVEWSVLLVEAKKEHVNRVATTETVDGAGDVTLTDYGEEDVFLVVSPLTEKDSDYAYSFEAELISATAGDTAMDSANPNDTGDGLVDGGGDETPAGCGCDTPDGGALGAAGLLMAALAAGRRRP